MSITKWKNKEIETCILYISYLLFLVTALLQNRNSMALGYGFSLASVGLFAGYLLINLDRVGKNLSFGSTLLILFTTVCLGLTAIFRFDFYVVIFYLKLVILVLFFSITCLSNNEFCKFINITYLIYCFISVLFFYNLLPFTIYSKWDHETMYVNLPFLSYYIFYGLEGGVSYIDSYSGMVLIINIFLNKSSDRKYFILLAAFFIMYTLKMTPLVGLFAGFAGYLVMRNRSTAIVSLLLGNFLFVIVVYWLVFSIDPLGPDYPFWELMHIATHARSMIWQQQTEIMLKEYDWLQYLFGGYNINKFAVPGLQVWGQETGTYYDNPHNTYLMLFFRGPVLFLAWYFSFLTGIVNRFDRKSFVPMLFIAVICYTNSTIISLQNPIYTYIVFFILVSKNGIKRNSNTLPASGE